jgi:hypothetical protein
VSRLQKVGFVWLQLEATFVTVVSRVMWKMKKAHSSG